MPGRTKIEREKAEIGLRLLEAPWDPEGRAYVLERMERLGMSQDALYVALVNAGWVGPSGEPGSSSTMKRWLRDTPYKPDADELWLLVVALAGYSANWPKASNLSSPELGYSFRFRPFSDFDLGLTPISATAA